MPPAGAQTTIKKQIAIKHGDGEPLTRSDIQYDLLYYIFSDTRAVFKDSYTTLHGDPPGTKVTFRDLYVNALVHSPRCSKVSHNKLLDTPQLADEFAKISLLSNMNRINTTMAFFPEMRTALRTYHPVPSLQKTDGNNLQDAPRIKNLLKFCLLPNEIQNTSVTPEDVLSRIRSGILPPTSIVNLIFIFQCHSSQLARNHFPASLNYELQDFFTPINISSESRARAFLWLCHHYYEGSSPNPYDDTYSEQHPGIIPKLYPLSAEEAQLENVDTPDEKAWGEKMTSQRALFLETKDKPMSLLEGPDEVPEGKASGQSQKQNATRGGQGGGRSKGRGGRAKQARATPLAGTSDLTARGVSVSSQDTGSFRAVSTVNSQTEDTLEGQSRGLHRIDSHLRTSSLSHHVDQRTPPAMAPFPSPPHISQSESAHHAGSYYIPRQSSSLVAEPYPSRRPSSTFVHLESSNGGPTRHSHRAHRSAGRWSGPPLSAPGFLESYSPRHPHHHATPTSAFSYTDSRSTNSRFVAISHRQPPTPPTNGSSPTFSQPRTMLQQAWHVVMTTDPLAESDDEQDENTRLDLLLRLKIINRLRGKEPTPEPEL
ncbi:hypothetical protein BC835DRAFT_1500935 [Cytidiella melzeri]|nr:hypothetical protein BC835DRAFT_1500935 [Cytidiella melzeri]